MAAVSSNGTFLIFAVVISFTFFFKFSALSKFSTNVSRISLIIKTFPSLFDRFFYFDSRIFECPTNDNFRRFSSYSTHIKRLITFFKSWNESSKVENYLFNRYRIFECPTNDHFHQFSSIFTEFRPYLTHQKDFRPEK